MDADCSFGDKSMAEEDLLAECAGDINGEAAVVPYIKLSTNFVKIDDGSSQTSEFRPSTFLGSVFGGGDRFFFKYASDFDRMVTSDDAFCKVIQLINVSLSR